MGIYKLNFKGTDKVYIGQSKNIESRYIRHLDSFVSNSASQKMIEAYKLYGTPTLEILCECSERELSSLEYEAIGIFNSATNGFNTQHKYNGQYTTAHGDMAGNSKYSNEIYLDILRLLATTNAKVDDIADELKVSRNVVAQIKQLVNHTWLKEVSPEYYSAIKCRYEKYNLQGRSIEYLGKPAILVSPSEEEVTVTSIKDFCSLYDLDPGNISKLISGVNKYTSGWRLKGTPRKEYVSFKSPEGIIFNLKDISIMEFSKQHRLDNSCMSKVAKGKSSHHKGWTIYKNV